MAECTEMAWRVSWQRPKSADYLWMAVSEPMAPLQACLMDMEWGAAALDDWVREPKRASCQPISSTWNFPWQHLQRQLRLERQQRRARRIQELEHCFPLMRRPGWTTYHKVMRKATGARRAAIGAWDHAVLFARSSGKSHAPCLPCASNDEAFGLGLQVS